MGQKWEARKDCEKVNHSDKKKTLEKKRKIDMLGTDERLVHRRVVSHKTRKKKRKKKKKKKDQSKGGKCILHFQEDMETWKGEDKEKRV